MLERMFDEAGIQASIHYVQAGVNLAQEARQAVENGASIVVAGGGDGTLSATAAGLTGTETTFGVLPVGTLNHFARDLKIPLDLEAAAKVVLQGHTERVDVGQVNSKTFLNNSILGLYPIYRFLKEDEKRRGFGRRMAFVRAAISVLRKYPSLKVRLYVNGQEIVRKTPYILIANNEHAMEGYQLGARQSLSEGKLFIYMLRNKGRLFLLRLLLKLLIGRFHAADAFEVFSAEEAWVDVKGKRVGVALDGEVTVLESPLHYRVLPSALKVFVPMPEEVMPATTPLTVDQPEPAPVAALAPATA